MSKIAAALEAFAHNITHPRFVSEALHEIDERLHAIEVKLGLRAAPEAPAASEPAGTAAAAPAASEPDGTAAAPAVPAAAAAPAVPATTA